ncbi:uroporphyrinogen-III synthase [Sphingobium sp.]|uniref:uroporphyrinogen-III synthase n=1 Tax=Sphingobium sp. TaxID=1912891 RepID=UPI003BB71B6E
MKRVLILRPEPGAGGTARKAARLGLDAAVHPLFAPQPLPWTPPPATGFDALLLTSANAARLAGEGLATYQALPSYAVGQATADALHTQGFATVIAGDADASAIAARIVADGHRRVLHLAGTTVAPMDAGPLHITRIAIYTMSSLPPDPALLRAAMPGSVLLIHSPRAGERLAEQIPPQARTSLHIVAISPAALAACGTGWASRQAPDRPQDDDMLALALCLCE